MTKMAYDFNDGNGPVPAHQHPNGDGWVADTATVAASAFIGPIAKVYGNAEVFGSALVSGNALVFGNAKVYGLAWATGDAKVSGAAWVYGYAWVYGNAKVSGNAKFYGDAKVFGDAQVFGDAKVFGDAMVSGDAWVSGKAKVYGKAEVSCDAVVTGNAEVSGNARVSGKSKVYGDTKVIGGTDSTDQQGDPGENNKDAKDISSETKSDSVPHNKIHFQIQFNREPSTKNHFKTAGLDEKFWLPIYLNKVLASKITEKLNKLWLIELLKFDGHWPDGSDHFSVVSHSTELIDNDDQNKFKNQLLNKSSRGFIDLSDPAQFKRLQRV